MTIFKTILLKTTDYDYVTKKIEVESNPAKMKGKMCKSIREDELKFK